ncbi:MAG: DUF805 domain-containing protein [Campylobacterales bacterium]|nr:DUF805 domain-containing protein [Campylobacterales bacterium]
MEYFNLYLKVLQNYTNIKGRATRSEFWIFLLFYSFGYYILQLIDHSADIYSQNQQLGFLTLLHIIIHITPFITLSIRRLHDIGSSGWWVFIHFIPYIGTPAFIVIAIIDSKDDNKYGVNPKKDID